jgi:hypothetical protein
MAYTDVRILIYGYLHAGFLIVQLQAFWLTSIKRTGSIKVVVMWKCTCGNRFNSRSYHLFNTEHDARIAG